MSVHAYATSPRNAKWSGPHQRRWEDNEFKFHIVTCYTNFIVAHIHVNATKICNITCTFVATCVILRILECSPYGSLEIQRRFTKTPSLAWRWQESSWDSYKCSSYEVLWLSLKCMKNMNHPMCRLWPTTFNDVRNLSYGSIKLILKYGVFAMCMWNHLGDAHTKSETKWVQLTFLMNSFLFSYFRLYK